MSHNFNFGPENVKILCEEVLDDVRFGLESVIIDECGIGDEGIVHLGQSLAKNTSLIFLDVS